MDDEDNTPLVTTSPLPVKTYHPPMQLDFPNAIREIMDGKKITRLSWNNPNTYGFFGDGEGGTLLRIHIGNEARAWAVNDGDMFATDWVVIEDYE